jgi:mannose-6-phosphate isomerase-like protein (cupin superfamily)
MRRAKDTMGVEKYLVKAGSLTSYSPANHLHTSNFRLIGRENVGAERLEVVLGVMKSGPGALPHYHPDIEQVCYLLDGQAHVTVDGVEFDLMPGDCCFFPARAKHSFVVTSEGLTRVLVIYSPPYEENPSRAVVE